MQHDYILVAMLFYQGTLALTATKSGLMFLFLPGAVSGLVGPLGGGLVMWRAVNYYWPVLLGKQGKSRTPSSSVRTIGSSPT